MTLKNIVVISDTHKSSPDYVLEHIKALKPGMILLNGDIDDEDTYKAYASLAPVFYAVRGDKDKLSLPHTLVHSLSGIHIGQIHGERPESRERPSVFFNHLFRGQRYFWNSFAEDALRQFSCNLDLLVCGHLHVPFIRRVGNTVVINPGAIVVNGKSYHLNTPTLALLEPYAGGFYPSILALEKGLRPYRLLVGATGPLKISGFSAPMPRLGVAYSIHSA